MKKKSFFYGILCMVMLCLLAGCGQKKENSPEGNGGGTVYVPERITLEEVGENSYLGNFALRENCLYYSREIYDETAGKFLLTLCEYSLEDGSVREIPIEMAENRRLFVCVPGADGAVYRITGAGNGEETEGNIVIGKYDSRGNVIFEQDITEAVRSVGEDTYIYGMTMDGQGNLYVCVDGGILLLNPEGEEQGMVDTQKGVIHGIVSDKDGQVYLCHRDKTAIVLSEVDYNHKKLGKIYRNLPDASGNISMGTKRDFLLNDGFKVYEYELAGENCEELFSWLDYDIDGANVVYIGTLQKGVYIAIVRNWNTGVTELVKLVEAGHDTDAPDKAGSAAKSRNENNTSDREVIPKEEIVIGTLYDNQELQTAVMAFNAANDAYHVTIKVYLGSSGEISYDDAVTNINKDIISEKDCPDLLDLARLNIEQLVVKGAIENLTPYLEQSSVFAEEDFVDNLLEGFTYDGTLATIPSRFNISTVVGKTSIVGEEMGWSVQEIMELAGRHPDSQLFANMDRGSFLYYYWMYNRDTFVDWTAGECHFDSQEFRELLEFAGTFPSKIDWAVYGNNALAEEKQSDAILLETVENIFDFQKIQLYPALFGEEVTFIGFPTVDGSVGCAMNVSDCLYGITTKSAHKDGAWAFMESYLAGSADSTFAVWGFPSMKDRLQEKIDAIWLLDENGERILDGQGEPIPFMANSKISYEDWEYIYHTPTEEEINRMLEIISVAKPCSNISWDTAIFNIIQEEASAYFGGDKSLDDVVDVIQNRVQVYVSENR